ncbi:MAG: hypothetical protein DGJ47_000644 [Rickettsiaceae bacterium]
MIMTDSNNKLYLLTGSGMLVLAWLIHENYKLKTKYNDLSKTSESKFNELNKSFQKSLTELSTQLENNTLKTNEFNRQIIQLKESSESKISDFHQALQQDLSKLSAKLKNLENSLKNDKFNKQDVQSKDVHEPSISESANHLEVNVTKEEFDTEVENLTIDIESAKEKIKNFELEFFKEEKEKNSSDIKTLFKIIDGLIPIQVDVFKTVCNHHEKLMLINQFNKTLRYEKFFKTNELKKQSRLEIQGIKKTQVYATFGIFQEQVSDSLPKTELLFQKEFPHKVRFSDQLTGNILEDSSETM